MNEGVKTCHRADPGSSHLSENEPIDKACHAFKGVRQFIERKTF
jgi:hypothetical protein